MLPRGWYPDNREEIASFIGDSKSLKGEGLSAAALSPHAGWYYSGRTACLSFKALKKNIDTIVIIGGHLGANSPFLYADEDGINTPLGTMSTDKELLKFLTLLEQPISPDSYRDNTVEVLLPMAHYFYLDAKLLWLRFPANISSYNAGKKLAEYAKEINRKIVVIGSTDLTHYGSNYGFSSHGFGVDAYKWVKEVNDANFIKAVLSGDPRAVLERAENNFSSCSAGAVLGAMGFA